MFFIMDSNILIFVEGMAISSFIYEILERAGATVINLV